MIVLLNGIVLQRATLCVRVCVCSCVCVCESLSHVQFFATSWTVAHQTLLSMGFSRQGYCSVAIPFSRRFSDPGIKPSLHCTQILYCLSHQINAKSHIVML